MATGTVVIAKSRAAIVDRLRGLLAAANCQIVQSSSGSLSFRHGTYLTQTATLYPKTCRLNFDEHDGTTTVHYDVHTAPLVSIFLTLWGILFCWTIIMPVIAYRTLVHHPKRFVENLLAGV